jgi:hypothetical protein
VRVAIILGAVLVWTVGCSPGPSGTVSDPTPIDCRNPPDLRPVPSGGVELLPGRIAVGYREAHVASRLCNREVVVGGGAPIMFREEPVPWIAHASLPPGTTATTRQRLILTRLTEKGEVAIRDVDYGNAQSDPLGTLDPRDDWRPGAYRLRVVVGTRVIADGTFVVAGAASSPASIAP